MICPEPISSSATSKSFINWARSIYFGTTESYTPTTRGQIVEIIRQAEDQNQRVKWGGSLWSFTESFVSNETYVETELISGQITNDVIIDRLTLTPDGDELRDNGLLLQVKGGTKVFNVNRILHGLPVASNGGGLDELNLPCGADSKAMFTLGGSGGQSIAGLVATGSHGGDVALPPIADAIMAIHLIGPGGQEWWIEKSAGLTAGTEEDTQAELAEAASSYPSVSEEICEHVIVRKNDNFFNSVLVSVGRMGFTYSFVFMVTNAFKLEETRTSELWDTFRDNLGPASFGTFVGTNAPHYLNVLINPFRRPDGHECKVIVRRRVPCSTDNVNMDDPGSPDIMNLFCGMQDVRWLVAVLVPTVAVLIGIVVGLTVAATALAAIPFIGWALAAGLYAAAAATAVVATALTALIGYLTVSGTLTSGELIAAIMNFAYKIGLKGVMTGLITTIYDGIYTLDPSTGVSWKIMDTYGYSSEDFCQKVDSMEFAFDVADATNGGYIGFIDSVLDIIDDLYNRNIAVAGVLALRYTANTSAKLGMSKFPATCHIEIPILKDFEGNDEYLRRVQRSAIAFRGVPHWGQIMSEYDGFNIRDLHQDDLMVWRQTLTELIRTGGGEELTFSNRFTATYNLEPWEDVAIESITVEITVGDDPLGDTDFLRRTVSADYLFVRIDGTSLVEISLNEGATWNAHSEHTRTVSLPTGTLWSDIRAVGIRHVAEGDDFNADNWGMNGIVISTTSVTGGVKLRYNDDANPIFYFQKNANRIWEKTF